MREEDDSIMNRDKSGSFGISILQLKFAIFKTEQFIFFIFEKFVIIKGGTFYLDFY